MSSVFQTLTSIIIWILFVNGCLGIIISPITRIKGEKPVPSLIAWAIAVASLFLAVLAIQVKHTIG